jgi:hypothetical protein
MRSSDWFVILAFVLFVSTHFITAYYIESHQAVATTLGVQERVVLESEANPIAKLFFKVKGINYVYTFVLLPGILFGTYLALRKKAKDAQNSFVLEHYALTILMVSIMNVLNDTAVLLGWLAHA